MNKQPNERVLTKDDGDLFQLVKRLTEEQPPGHALSQVVGWSIRQVVNDS